MATLADDSDTTEKISLGPIGVWRTHGLTSPALAAELEKLGYGALWLGSVPDLTESEELLDATETLVLATGIVNVWKIPAEEAARGYHRIAAKHSGRFLLGVGIGHREATAAYAQPYQVLVDYLDALDEAGVPKERRALAALGPRVLKLSAERTAGAHPYLVNPEHTRSAREVMGEGALLAPEQKVLLGTDRAAVRAAGNPVLRRYLGMANYISNLRRLGFDDEDFAGDGSDRLFDAVIVHGGVEQVAAGLRAHLDAGADHVALQVLGEDDPLPAYRELAAALEL
jgi:probable F420-dependent oxidoreductase